MLNRLKRWWRRKSETEPKSFIKIKGCRVRVEILGPDPIELLEVGEGASIETDSHISVNTRYKHVSPKWIGFDHRVRLADDPDPRSPQ